MTAAVGRISLREVHNFPTLRDAWEIVKVDSSVAKYAIVCATVVLLGIIGGLVTVVSTTGDAGAFAIAIATVLTAVTTFVTSVLRRKGGGTDGETSGNR